MSQWKRVTVLLIIVLSALATGAQASAQSPENSANSELINITPEGQQAAGIKVESIQLQQLPLFISAPGEVIPNTDQSAIVAPRIKAQVVKRIVKVGEHVTSGQPLVELSSVEMANAQGNLLLASKEWQRMGRLGKQAVSAKRYQSAQVAYHQAYGKLLAYGMTRDQIDDFLKSDNPNKASGNFTLLAPRSGTIFSAKFTEGQMVEPGFIIYRIVNEQLLWVDARLSNDDVSVIKKNAKVMIKTNQHQFIGRVLQVHHQLEESTRTQIVRIEVPNTNDLLHPGQFVTCFIQTGKTQPVLAIPKGALMRAPDGDYSVYVEIKPNYFKAMEVTRVTTIRDLVIIKGVQPNTRVVVQGAFFVHSEALKKGFSTHNH